jgi:hypothetical protein
MVMVNELRGAEEKAAAPHFEYSVFSPPFFTKGNTIQKELDPQL